MAPEDDDEERKSTQKIRAVRPEEYRPPTMVPCPAAPHANCLCCYGAAIVTVDRRNEYMAGAVVHERVVRLVEDELPEPNGPDETCIPDEPA